MGQIDRKKAIFSSFHVNIYTEIYRKFLNALYVVEWRARTQKKNRNDITNEPNVINGLFINTGGAFGIYDFWRLHKKYPQVFSHPSMEYTDQDWFDDGEREIEL